MTSVAIEQAQKDLAQLIENVSHGEQVVITKDKVPVAELVPIASVAPQARFGSAKGKIAISDDFDAQIEDFRNYMQ